ncbi:MAG: glycosyltransferase family 4 protein [Thermoleophilia bacterium]
MDGGNGRRRVLVITKYLPDGPPSGGLIRTEVLIDALRRRYDVRVLGYVERGDGPRPRSRVSSLVNGLLTRRAYSVARWDTRWMRIRIAEEMARFAPEAVFVDHSQVAPLADGLGLPRAMDMHNVESIFAQGVADTTRGPTRHLAARDARLLRKLEQRIADEYELVVVNSPKEAERAAGSPEVIPNGVFPEKTPLEAPPDPDLITFVALFSWLPNIDGAEWLVNEVMPLLPPRVRVRLVGRDPHPRVKALAGPRVEVTGEVPETWSYVSAGLLALCPILSTGGTRHKILEGLLAERPVVSTRMGAEGLEDLEGHGLVLAETPEEFARAVTELMDDPARAAELGRLGRRTVIERYDWARIGEQFADLFAARLGLD